MTRAHHLKPMVRKQEEMKEIQESEKKISEKQNQLIQSESYATIGQLAAGVAHEVNNPLGFIDSNLSTLGKYLEHITAYINLLDRFKRHIQDNDVDAAAAAKNEIEQLKRTVDFKYIFEDIQSLIAESRSGVDRIKKIIANLKTFSEIDEGKTGLADINEIIAGVLEILAGEVKNKVKVLKEFGRLPSIQCNPQQLGHVFINLIKNAVQAMPRGGQLTIRTGVREMKIGEPRVGRRQDDLFADGARAVYIEIEDTGEGILKDDLEKIFDPFFTTRNSAQCPGLGLSVSSDLVRRHKGLISVKSQVGEGSTFTVLLPAGVNP